MGCEGGGSGAGAGAREGLGARAGARSRHGSASSGPLVAGFAAAAAGAAAIASDSQSAQAKGKGEGKEEDERVYLPCEAVGDGLKGQFWRAKHENVAILELDYEPLTVLLTHIRDRDTPSKAYNYFVHRLASLTLELALGMLPSEEVVVTTPGGHKVQGAKRDDEYSMCAVTLSRTDVSPLAEPLKRLIPDMPVGKARYDPVSQRASITGLPPGEAGRKMVLLLVAVADKAPRVGAAIDALLRAGVEAENIMVVCLLVSPEVADMCATEYKDVQVVASSIEIASADGELVPGVGNFAERYFAP